MNDDEKVCPRCAETVKTAALVCKHCGHEFAASPEQPKPLKITIERKAVNKRGCLVAFLVLAGLVIGIGIFGSQHNSPDSAPQPNSQPTQASANKREPISIDMSVAVASANPLTIAGTTNLPDGTTLSGELKGETPGCLPQCGFEFKSIVVRSGHFTGQIASTEQLVPDTYTVDIVTPAAMTEPQSVQSIIGKSGENLQGPYIVTLESGGQYVPANFSPGHTLSAGETMLGLMVHFTQRIQVTADRDALPIPCADSSNNSGVDCGLLIASPPPAVAAAQPNVDLDPEKAFTQCLLREGHAPQYISSDGGQSAMQLMGQCEKQWNAYSDACVKAGESDGDCNLKSAELAQMALKMLGK